MMGMQRGMDACMDRESEGGMPALERRRFLRLNGKGSEPAEGFVVVEEPLQIQLNGRPVAVLMRTPGQEKELAVGYCVTEGLVTSFEAIGLVQHCGGSAPAAGTFSDPLDISRNIVNITTLDGQVSDRPPEVMRLVRSGCGRADPGEVAEQLTPLENALQVPAEVIRRLARSLAEGQRAYREAGGVHAVAIFDAAGNLVALSEDVGRHNAIDKAIGYCLLRRIPLHDKILYSTGRASYEMVTKAVRVGLPVAISRSSATTLAIDLAERLNCTLVGYARAGRMTIYTHAWRVVMG
ncbi:MAG: formate dehydrogenase accessory sulfurtransferase FdhD [Anaerolineae bacterium]|nr:formate dehydrogenase accessory sulfurtransferase FdhD [Anaerolineae bacterium]